MRRALSLLLFVVAMTMAWPDAGECGVRFLAHYNKSLDADVSMCALPKATVQDARLTEGAQGYPFPGSAPSAECADIGYTVPAPKGAGLLYDAGNIDPRQGTIQMWIKTPWDWDNPKHERVDQDRCFFSLPLAGGQYNSINFYFACGPGFGFLPSAAFYIHDGQRDYMCYARVGSQAPTDFRWQKETWHYFVLTWTPRRMHLYADGKLLAQREFDVPMSLSVPDGPMIIGNRHRDLLRPANALIDEVRILDFPLEGNAAAFAPPTAELEEKIVGSVVAVGGPAQEYHPELRRYFAYRTGKAPTLDGDLSDAAWQAVPAAGGFISLEGQRAPVPEQTEVKACYDDTCLYLAVLCHEDAVAKLEARAKADGDGQVFADDAVEVFLSADPSGMPCLQLGVNPANRSCGYFYDAARKLDRAWKGTYRSAIARGEREWRLELAFPFADFTKVPPKAGDRWRWNVCRDRRAGVGLQYSTMNFITAAFLSPEEYGELLFGGEPRGAAEREEAELNRDYLARVRRDVAEFAGQVRREVKLLDRVPAAAKQAAGLSAGEAGLRAAGQRLLALAQRKEPARLSEWGRAQLEMKALRRQLNEFASRAGGLGPAASLTIPPTLKPGIYDRPGCWLLVSAQLAAAVDKATGMIAGLWEKRTGRRLLTCSYDIYQAETRDAEWRSDERLDRVSAVRKEAALLELTCTNPDLPGVKLKKRFVFASVPVAGGVGAAVPGGPRAAAGAEPRILCRRLEIGGTAKALTLLKVSANAIFERAFREKSYYDRIFVIGTIGDPRSQAWAKDVRESIMQRAWFTATEGRAQFAMVDPGTQTGLAQCLYKVNDRWVYPQGMAQSYWTPFGWEMGFGGTFVKPAGKAGRQESFETRFHLFHGDHLDYHREYLRLPEHAAVMADWRPHPDAARIRAIGGGMIGLAGEERYGKATFGALNAMARPDEIIIGLHGQFDDRWGVWPAGDSEEFVALDAAGRETRRTPCARVKQNFADLHRLYPRCRACLYRFIADIYNGAPAAKEHPEWILKDKHGRPVTGSYGPVYLAANWCPAFVDYLTQGLLRTTDYTGEDALYLDYGTGSILADWGRGEVVQLHVFADFLKRLHGELAKRGKLLWLNSLTGQFYYDIGYHEGDGAAHHMLGQWRNGAAIDLARKLYTRPGTACVPLYWKGGDQFVADGTANEDRYRNLILGCGLMTTGCWLDPYDKHFHNAALGGTDWSAVFQYQIAPHFTAAELLPSRWAEIGLSPAHWRDFDSEYETFTLQQGPAYLLNVISHKKEPGDAAFTVDPAKMRLQPGKPLFFWQFDLRDPKGFPKQAPVPANWDRMFERARCQVLRVPKGKLSLTLDALQPDRLRMAAMTQTPAFLASVAGKPTQLLLPENLGCRLSVKAGAPDGALLLSAQMRHPGEALVWLPKEWAGAKVTVGGKAASSETVEVGGERFLKIALPAGTSDVMVARQAAVTGP